MGQSAGRSFNVHFVPGPVKVILETITDLWLSGRTFIKMSTVPSFYQTLLKWLMDLGVGGATQRMITITIIATRADLVQFWILCAPDTKNISDTLDSAIVNPSILFLHNKTLKSLEICSKKKALEIYHPRQIKPTHPRNIFIMNYTYCKRILCRINKLIIFNFGPIVKIHFIALGGLNYNE